MKKQQDIEQLAQQALNSLNNVQPTDANPFLYTKIKQRMAHQHTIAQAHQSRILLRLAAVLLLFIGLNGLSFYALKSNHAYTSNTQQTGATAFAEAYQLNSNTNSY